jgi:hypothetical protein
MKNYKALESRNSFKIKVECVTTHQPNHSINKSKPLNQEVDYA